MRLPRPYIPTSVRFAVALRQFNLSGPHRFAFTSSDSANLKRILQYLFGGEVPHLDHDPPLGAREKMGHWDEEKKDFVIVGYRPDAKDPEYLIYRTAHEHQIKTNVRGVGAQHPDRVLIKRQRRRERGWTKKPSRKIPHSKGVRWASLKTQDKKQNTKRKYKWPKRSFRSATGRLREQNFQRSD